MLSFPVPPLCQTVDFALLKFGAKAKLRYLCVCFQYLLVTQVQVVGQADGYSKYPGTATRHPVPPRRLREQQHLPFLSSQVIQIFFFSGTRCAMTFTSLLLRTKGNTLHWHQTDQHFSKSLYFMANGT